MYNYWLRDLCGQTACQKGFDLFSGCRDLFKVSTAPADTGYVCKINTVCGVTGHMQSLARAFCLFGICTAVILM